MTRIARRPGFTVLEFVLVMTIIVVLAAISIPVALNAQREAREAKLLANLHEIRNAIQRFVADCGGYPEKLEHLLDNKPPKFCRRPKNGGRMKIDPQDFRGPYLYTANEKFPRDSITRKRVWGYEKRTGTVWSLSKDTALDGSQYSEW